jgi:hypothetical protein
MWKMEVTAEAVESALDTLVSVVVDGRHDLL